MQQLVILLVINCSSYGSPFTGQKTIGSEMQSDLLMMGVKMPKTC
jgi:hypothetical protein